MSYLEPRPNVLPPARAIPVDRGVELWGRTHRRKGAAASRRRSWVVSAPCISSRERSSSEPSDALADRNPGWSLLSNAPHPTTPRSKVAVGWAGSGQNGPTGSKVVPSPLPCYARPVAAPSSTASPSPVAPDEPVPLSRWEALGRWVELSQRAALDRLGRAPYGWSLGAGLAAFLLALPYLFPGGPALRPWGINLPFEHDEATVVYDAYRIVLGELPYVDFFNFKGPVFGLLNAFVLAVWPDWMAAQLLFVVVTALAAGLLASVVQRTSGTALALFAVVLHATAVVPVWPRPYEQWLAEALALGAAAALVGEGGTRASRLGLAGGLLALCALTVQSIGMPALVAGWGIVALRGAARCQSGRLRGLVADLRWILAGSGAVLLVFFVSAAALGALDEVYEQAWLWPRRAYAASQTWPWGHGSTDLYLRLEELDDSLLEGLGKATGRVIICLPYGLAAAVGAGILRFLALPGRWNYLGSDRFVSVMLAGACGAHLTYPGINTDLTHLAFAGGFSLWGIAASFGGRGEIPADGSGWFRQMGQRWNLWSSRAAIAIGAAGALATLCLYGALFVRTWPKARAMGSWEEAARSNTHFYQELQTLPADAQILYGGYGPGYVYFYSRPAATPLTNFPYVPQGWPNYYSKEQYAWMQERLAQPSTKAMVVSRHQLSHILKIYPGLYDDFQAVATRGSLTYLLRRAPKDAPPETPRDGPRRSAAGAYFD